jgi:uncharacterized protein YgbK (DUF1537 family)
LEVHVPEVVIVADDLSGASEAAATFLLRTTRISIVLDTLAAAPSTARVVAVDTGSRGLTPAEAAITVKQAVGAGTPLLKKIDSLLRGNLAAEVATLRDMLGATPIIATALPAAGRTVVGGVPLIGGIPLVETGLWHAERRRAPATVADAFAPLATVAVPLAVVRSGELAEALAGNRIPVCDAETDEDLDAIYAAARSWTVRPLLVGSAGLVAAAARALPADRPTDRPEPTPYSRNHRVLVVAGTSAPSFPIQLAVAKPHVDEVVRVVPADLLANSPQWTDRLRAAGTAVVTIDGAIDHSLSPELVRRLADAVAPIADDGRALILTGGETARAVLDRLGVRHLRPVSECEGAVVSVTDDGRVVATRPGSFGGPASLAGLVRTVLSKPKAPKEPA